MNGNGRNAGTGVAHREDTSEHETEQEEQHRPPHGEKGDDESNGRPKKTKKPPAHKRPVVLIIIGAVLLVAIIAGILYWLHARHYVSTDDAYLDGNIVQVAPRVSALVRARHIDDNQFVRQGDLLIELDPTDYKIALLQARAQFAAAQGRLAQAEAQSGVAKASVTQASAQITAAQVALDNTTRDLERYQSVDARARSRHQLDNATAAQKNAQAQLEQARAGKASAEANVGTSEAAIKAAEADVKTAEANVERAEVNLGYCNIYAPSDGRVTQRSVEVGNYVQTGQIMFMLVQPDVWVTANFKETQLARMQPGQPVSIRVDAFPGRKFNGHVDSIQAGSGSRFGVLPAENATGNFVKIVQRVPVKIIFDHGANTNDVGLLSPGLSVRPSVRVR